MSRLRFVLPLLLVVLAGCDIAPTVRPPPPTAAPPTLHQAAARSDTNALATLLAGGADPNTADIEGLTPLHHAALSGSAESIRMLATHGADPNAVDSFGATPLHEAAREGHLDAAVALVDAGANLLARDREGRTPYGVALELRRTEVHAFLASRGGGPPADERAVAPEEASEPPPAMVITGGEFRVWTSHAGATIDAEFQHVVLDTVVLRKRDGSMVRIHITRLSPADQVLARQLAGSVRQVRPDDVARGVAMRGDSIGLRIGRDRGWTVLEKCRFLRAGGNDGDSFHVKHEGKEYIFRLYYVDAPETSMAFPDRVSDQARYFRFDEDHALRVGAEAKTFTANVLSRGPFTVVTKWEDAKGNSELPRFYAFVVTDAGDLDELLAAEGLVRLYGMRVDSGLGSRKYGRLKRLEQDAERAALGAWGLRGASAHASPEPARP